ncbi:HK97-gp10 family putative phage morphogenesis protein [Streptomyces sp. DH37]|uniref:HK97-gp10 family putative phage morphogenesis protein n=1 Tax=Streptomyces sp. DH37 TaxID=3040122 RepID=UPI0024427E6F|nr:HK97-gp10 family putative phage morphogenesis protein [Streptomyces sp. DH37]MDG9705546.1 HK97 gp10 family phage protein [Streptomyces sp. DH37]
MASSVTGLRGVLARLGRLPAAAREARAETLEWWAETVKDDAQDRAPERTGHLSGTVDSRVYQAQGVARVGVWEPRALEYAQYVEQGTSSMEAQPYLVPAFWAARGEVPKTYRRAFARAMRR